MYAHLARFVKIKKIETKEKRSGLTNPDLFLNIDHIAEVFVSDKEDKVILVMDFESPNNHHERHRIDITKDIWEKILAASE